MTASHRGIRLCQSIEAGLIRVIDKTLPNANQAEISSICRATIASLRYLAPITPETKLPTEGSAQWEAAQAAMMGLNAATLPYFRRTTTINNVFTTAPQTVYEKAVSDFLETFRLSGDDYDEIDKAQQQLLVASTAPQLNKDPSLHQPEPEVFQENPRHSSGSEAMDRASGWVLVKLAEIWPEASLTFLNQISRDMAYEAFNPDNESAQGSARTWLNNYIQDFWPEPAVQDIEAAMPKLVYVFEQLKQYTVLFDCAMDNEMFTDAQYEKTSRFANHMLQLRHQGMALVQQKRMEPSFTRRRELDVDITATFLQLYALLEQSNKELEMAMPTEQEPFKKPA